MSGWSDGQVIKLQNLCFKFPLKKISCKDREIKKKSCRAGAIKKISSSRKILQPPHQKSNSPPLKNNAIQRVCFFFSTLKRVYTFVSPLFRLVYISSGLYRFCQKRIQPPISLLRNSFNPAPMVQTNQEDCIFRCNNTI